MKTLLLVATFTLLGNAYAVEEVNRLKTGVTNEKLQVKSDTLNSLIKGELAAVETYDTAIKKIEKTKEKVKLETIRNNHQTAADKLSSYVAPAEKKEVKDAGMWGTIADTYTGGATLFGDKATVKALTQGEEHGMNEYKEALADNKLPKEIRQMIETQFIPTQKQNLQTLKKFI